MKKEDLILEIATDMLNGFNIHQLVQVARDFSLLKAEEYYENLTEDQIAELKARFTAARQEGQERQEEESEKVTTP